QYGRYEGYRGIEVDASRITTPRPRKHAVVEHGCVFAKRSASFDACIGNPPYLRHHDIESPWKEETLRHLGDELGVVLSGRSNLFLYFMALGLLRTRPDGICGLLVPFDWVSRPSGRSLRALIRSRQWGVSVYRFTFP